MNKKIASEIAIGVILLLAIVVGGIFWLQNKKEVPAVQPVVTQSTQIAQMAQSTITQFVDNSDSNYIEYQGNKITLKLPQSWGNLIVPTLDDLGGVIDSSYGTIVEDSVGDKNYIQLEHTGLGTEFTKMISDYKYGNKSEYLMAPSITLATYPNFFSDDDETGEYSNPWPLTAKQKEVDFQPLLDSFKQGNIDKLNLSEKCFLVNDAATNCANSNKGRGFWWDNIDNIADRVAVRYFENSNSDLRGIGYFSIVGQDMPSTPDAYKIVLVNPQKRILVYAYFPLNGAYSFPRLTNDKIDFKKAYDYLEKPENYKNTQLEQFMNEIQILVSSIKISS